MKKIITCIIPLVLASSVHAQDSVEKALKGGDKINAVYVVLLIIFLGIVVYLWTQDARIKKIEERINNNK